MRIYFHSVVRDVVLASIFSIMSIHPNIIFSDVLTYLRDIHNWLCSASRSCVSMKNVNGILPLILLSIAGCTPAPHSENVKPGDADYPVVNPSPVNIITLTVIIPASIKAQLHQGYTTRGGGGSIDSGPPCAYIPTLSQARIQYGIAPELELRRMAPDSFSGQIILDRYLPGSCNWGFAGVWYSVGNRDNAELLRVDRPQALIGNGRIDLWCLRHPKRDPRIPDTCMDIHAIRSQFPEELSATTLAEIEAGGGGGEVPVFIAPGLQTLVIQFHDLTAAGGDLALRVN